MLSLTTNITMPTIRKVYVERVIDNRDDDADPSFGIRFQLWESVTDGKGSGRCLGTFTATARDAANSRSVKLTASPTGFGDVVAGGGSVDIPNAMTTLGAFYDAAVGGKKAKAEATYGQAVVLGLIGPGLAAT